MPLHVNTVTFDADDPPALAAFWASVFEIDPPEPVSPFVSILAAEGAPRMMFIKNVDVKAAKNRVHLDLHADDEAAVDVAAERLVAAGASLVGKHTEHDVYWSTLQDPEGNEFCVGTPLRGH